MRIVDQDIEDLAQIEKLPFVFLKSYAQFQNSFSGKRYIIIEENNIIIPILIYKKKIISIGQCLFTPIYINGQRPNTKEEKDFLENLLKFCLNSNLIDKFIPPFLISVNKVFPLNSQSCNFGSLFIDLQNSEEELFKRINSSYRTQIKKAKNSSIEIINSLVEFNAFYQLYYDTHIRQNIVPDNYNTIKNLILSLGNNNICCFVAKYNNKIEAGALVAHTNYGAYYLYGGTVHTPSINGINKLLHWEILLFLKKKQIEKYVMGGARIKSRISKFNGIQLFKERMGCEIENGYIWKKNIAYFKSSIYENALNLKNLMRNRKNLDVIDQELKKIEE